MNISKSLYISGVFVRYFSFFLLLPLASIFFTNYSLKSFLSNDFLIKSLPFIYSSIIALIFSLIITNYSQKKLNFNDSLGRKDGFLIASLIWIFAGFFGALPYYFSSSLIPNFFSEVEPLFKNNVFINSFFESVSGITTTGASVFSNFPNIDQHYMIIFWRSLSQWLGGIGIILLVLIIFPKISVGIMQLASDQEGTGPQKERITPKLYQTGLTLLFIYLGITLLLFFVLYFIGNLSSFDSIVHSFSTVSSGGFSSYELNVEGMDNFKVEMIILIFMFLSGISFAMFYYLISANFNKIYENTEFKAFVLINILLICLLVLILNNNNIFDSLTETLRYGAFQAVSISTGTGFTSYNFNQWPGDAKILLLIILIIGGSSGSTTGGIKIIRLVIILKSIYLEIRRRISPNVIYTVKINNKSLDDEVVSGVMSFLFLFLALTIFSIILLSLLEPNVSITTAASAVLSSISNLGPGFEGINPHSSYNFFSSSSKVLLTFLMLLGRLEIFTMIALLLPSFWRKY